jgi:excisionase family DNA binding protein
MSKLMTMKGASERLHVSTSTIRNWIDKGYITAVRFPSGVRRLPEDEVERLASQLFELAPFIEENDAPAPRRRREEIEPDEWGTAV